MTAREVLAWLEQRASRRNVEGMARYGIKTQGRVYGVSMGTMQPLARRIGKDHVLALKLWETDCYEARIMAAFVAEPQRVTKGLMNAWARDFDNWAVCDTVCFHLFDRTPLAYEKIGPWARSPREFVKRAGFALMACLALHDKQASDAPFLAMLPVIEKGSRDDRNFVKKAVSWALRSVGRRSPAVYARAVALAERLSKSKDPPARWVGKDALRDLTRPKVRAAMKKARGAQSLRLV